MDACEILNMQITKLNIIVTLVTDIILLFVMFIGLLRLRLHERGTFGLGRLLWRQVGYWYFSLAVVFSSADAAPHSQGSHLALGCHHRRSPARGKWLVSCLSFPFIAGLCRRCSSV
jgi:hypothetical protein